MEKLQITLQVKTKCEVYLCNYREFDWKSDDLQQLGFVKKNEKVEGSNGGPIKQSSLQRVKTGVKTRIGYAEKLEMVETVIPLSECKMMIHHKTCFGSETVILPETLSKDPLVTIFVK